MRKSVKLSNMTRASGPVGIGGGRERRRQRGLGGQRRLVGAGAKADAPWRWAWRSASAWSRGSAGRAKAMRPAASGRSQPSARKRLARSAASATSRLGGSRPTSAHGWGPWRREDHHQALARIDFRRGAIGFQRKAATTGEIRQLERRAARLDFPRQAGHDRGPSRHRLQVKGDAVGHSVLRHVGIERRHVRCADRRRGRVDGQVRVDFDPRAGAHLPAHARQQVGLERPERRRKEDLAQRGAGGRERGIGMDHHGIGAELAHVHGETAKGFILRSGAHRGHGIEPEADDAPGSAAGHRSAGCPRFRQGGDCASENSGEWRRANGDVYVTP